MWHHPSVRKKWHQVLRPVCHSSHQIPLKCPSILPPWSIKGFRLLSSAPKSVNLKKCQENKWCTTITQVSVYFISKFASPCLLNRVKWWRYKNEMINRTIPGLSVSLVSVCFFGFIQLFSLPAVQLNLTVFYGALTKNLSCTVRFLPACGIKTPHSSGLSLGSFVTKCDKGCTVCMARAASAAYVHTSNSTVHSSTAE